MKRSYLLTNLRQKQDLKQKEAAKRARMSPTYLSLVENGKKEASVQVLRRLSKLYGIPYVVLAWEKPETKSLGKKEKAIIRNIDSQMHELVGTLVA